MLKTMVMNLTEAANDIRRHLLAEGLCYKDIHSEDGIMEVGFEGTNRDGGEVQVLLVRNVIDETLEVVRNDYHRGTGTLANTR